MVPLSAALGCRGINPCGMMMCLHCRNPFLFRLSDYPDYIVSPMANRIVSQVVDKCCPHVEVPNPVRRDADEIARVLRFGACTGKSSLRIIINPN